MSLGGLSTSPVAKDGLAKLTVIWAHFTGTFEPRWGAIYLLERRINFHLAISASSAACANALTSLSAFLSTTNVETAP